jgi:drug/metabolite transporter (DMT)-like permease
LTGELLALFSALAFSFASVAIARGARSGSGESGVFLSAVLTAVLSVVAWSVSHQSISLTGFPDPLWIAAGWFAVSGLLATVGGRTTLFKSIEYAGVVRASTTRRLMPFMALLLAWLILGEGISWWAGAGMALIAASFAFLYVENRQAIKTSPEAGRSGLNISRGLAFGFLSAALYASSFIARKFGLGEVPNPYFGALVGSLVALLHYAGGCLVSTRFRSLVWRSFARPDPWQLLAAFCMSVGQISQFAALMRTDVSRVAFINSVEVYLSAALAVLVFRTESPPSRPILVAMALATGGVIMIAAGA